MNGFSDSYGSGNFPRLEISDGKAVCKPCGCKIKKGQPVIVHAFNRGPTGKVFMCLDHAKQLAEEMTGIIRIAGTSFDKIKGKFKFPRFDLKTLEGCERAGWLNGETCQRCKSTVGERRVYRGEDRGVICDDCWPWTKHNIDWDIDHG